MGFVLDTCVVSEMKKPQPAHAVARWIRDRSPRELYLTTTVVGELSSGIERLPVSRRRSDLEKWLGDLLTHAFVGRILDFDLAAALVFGPLVAGASAKGRPAQPWDAQIAAVAFLHDMTVATRDTGDFEPFGVPLIDPWTA